MPSSSPAEHIFFLILFYFIATCQGNESFENFCMPNEFGRVEKSDMKCILVFEKKNQASWERAQKSCRKISSFLLDSRFINTIKLQRILKRKGTWNVRTLHRDYSLDVLMQEFQRYNLDILGLQETRWTGKDLQKIWIGIKKMAGFYAWQTSSFELFKESDNWGTKWENEDVLTEDCVALNVSSGNLIDAKCSNELPYVCMNNGLSRKPVRSVTNISVSISQSDPGSIRSSKDLLKTLACKMFSNGNASDPLQQEFVTYQWLKDGIPLKVHDSTIYLSVVEDDTKQNFTIFNQQGKYQCIVLITGLDEYVRSEEVEIYFSDVSRYAFVIEDNLKQIPFNQAVDFSRANFSHFLDLFREPMDNALRNLTSDDSTLSASVDWDFQNISITKEKVKLTLQLYLNGTEDDKNLKPENEIRIRMLLQESLFNVFSTKWNLSPQSMSLIFSDTYINRGYQTTCGHDYEPLLNDWCYKLINEEMSWNDATEACRKNYSYLYSNILYKIPNSSVKEKYEKLQDIFNQLGEFWVAGKRINGLFQWEGITPETMAENAELVWARNEPKDDNDCASIANVSSQNFVVRSRNCSEEMKFICMHQKVVISRMSSCEGEWGGTLINDKCYLKVKELMKWQAAKEHCAEINSRLLTLPDLKTYNLIKTFIKSMTFDGISWWFGLQRKGSRYEWQNGELVNLTFAEWSRNISFAEQISHGALTLNSIPNDQSEVNWNLFHPNVENFFICEKNQTKNPPEATVVLKMKKHKVKVYDLNIHLDIPSFICEAQHSLYGSVVWYRNEVAIEGDRGKDWKPYFSLESNLTSSNLKTHLQSQGYYACSVEQQFPFKSIKSSSVLYQVKGVETFATTMFSEKVFSELHRNMSRGDFWASSNESEIEKELGKILENILIVNLKNLTVNSSGSEFLFHLYDIEDAKKEQSDIDMSTKIVNYFTGPSTDALRQNIEAWLASYNISQKSIQVKSTNACPESETISQGDLLTWPRTLANSFTQPKEGCFSVQHQPIVRWCIPNFETGAFWDEPQNCQTFHKTLKTLSQLEINSSNVLVTAGKLSQLSSNSFDLNSTDIHFISTIMRNIAEASGLNSSVLQKISVVASNLLNLNKHSVFDDAQDESNSLSIITESLERILSNTEMEASSLKIEESGIAMQSWKLSEYSSNHLPLGLSSDYSSDVDKLRTTELFNISDILVDGILAGVLLPVDLVNNHSAANETLNVIFYKNPSLFLHIQSPRDKFIINSPVIYASFETEVRNLTSPVQLVMHPLNESLINTSEAICVYVRRNDSFESWAEDGCSLQLINHSYVCHCNHLTNFAVLTSMYSHEMEPNLPLSVISYIGCGLSVIGLIMTIVTYAFFRNWRKGNNHKIICNLSVALLSVMLLFTIGIERTEPKFGCTIVAVLLHYSLLASFCWMLVEAVDLYLKLVKVLSTYISRFMRKAIIFAWGLPLVIVTIVLLASSSAYDSQMRYCWLSKESFFYAFALPVIILLLINFVIFCFIMQSICKKDIENNQDDRNFAIKRFRAAVCIYFLLGLSWLFGFLAINEAKEVFQYLFAITTTAQGFFIFIFFVLREESSRKMWYELFHSSNKENLHSLHTTANLSSYNNRKCS